MKRENSNNELLPLTPLSENKPLMKRRARMLKSELSGYILIMKELTEEAKKKPKQFEVRQSSLFMNSSEKSFPTRRQLMGLDVTPEVSTDSPERKAIWQSPTEKRGRILSRVRGLFEDNAENISPSRLELSAPLSPESDLSSSGSSPSQSPASSRGEQFSASSMERLSGVVKGAGTQMQPDSPTTILSANESRQQIDDLLSQFQERMQLELSSMASLLADYREQDDLTQGAGNVVGRLSSLLDCLPLIALSKLMTSTEAFFHEIRVYKMRLDQLKPSLHADAILFYDQSDEEFVRTANAIWNFVVRVKSAHDKYQSELEAFNGYFDLEQGDEEMPTCRNLSEFLDCEPLDYIQDSEQVRKLIHLASEYIENLKPQSQLSEMAVLNTKFGLKELLSSARSDMMIGHGNKEAPNPKRQLSL